MNRSTPKKEHEREMSFFPRNGHNHDGKNSTPVEIPLGSIGLQHLNQELVDIIMAASLRGAGEFLTSLELVPNLNIVTNTIAPGGYETGTLDWVDLTVVRFTRIIMTDETECNLHFYHTDSFLDEDREFRSLDCCNGFLWEGLWAHFDEQSTERISWKVENIGSKAAQFEIQLKTATYVEAAAPPRGRYLMALINWPATPVAAITPVSAGERSDSAAMCSDGRVIYMFCWGTEIRQGYAESPSIFCKENNSISNITTLYDFPSRHYYGYTIACQNCCVFNGPNGELFAVISYCFWTANNLSRSFIIHSPSGLGNDWVEYSTIQQQGPANGNFISTETGEKSAGEMFFLPNGRWIWPGTEYRGAIDGLVLKHAAVFTSDDYGLSWTKRKNQGYWIVGGPYGWGSARNIGQSTDGSLWWTCDGNVGENYIFRSTDGGTTWIHIYSHQTGTHRWFPIADSEYLYAVEGSQYYGVRGGLYRSSSPTVQSSWELLYDYPIGNANGGILQKLGSRLALMMDGQLIDIIIAPDFPNCPAQIVYPIQDFTEVRKGAFNTTEDIIG